MYIHTRTPNWAEHPDALAIASETGIVFSIMGDPLYTGMEDEREHVKCLLYVCYSCDVCVQWG